jgi:hypothetical protein
MGIPGVYSKSYANPERSCSSVEAKNLAWSESRHMITTLTRGKPWRWFIPIVGLTFLLVAYLYVRSAQKPVATAIPIVSGCKKLGPGLKRIGEPYRVEQVEFDIPAGSFNIDQWSQDAPPNATSFRIGPKNDASYLSIDFGPAAFPSSPLGAPIPQALMPPAPRRQPAPSGHVETRTIFDDKGTAVGEDSWGYWDGDERWRRVLFPVGTVVARYGSINKEDVANHGSVHQKEAELFDRIINSVCIPDGPYGS